MYSLWGANLCEGVGYSHGSASEETWPLIIFTMTLLDGICGDHATIMVGVP